MSVKTLDIKKVYPLVSELNSVQNIVTCTEDGCKKVFTSQSNLFMHLQKHHKRRELEKSDECIKQFYCPEQTCPYHSDMFFKKIKYLKQHYLKVHADRRYSCMKCSKGFPTEAQLSTHKEICGVEFSCLDCSCAYKSYEALLTHARRKGHNISSKSAFIAPKNCNQVQKCEFQTTKNSLILPKRTVQTINIIPVILQLKADNLKVDREMQTEQINVKPSKCKTNLKRRSTQHTQTCVRKKPRRTAETQTTGDCILKRAIQEAKITVKGSKSDEKRCMETQTKSLLCEKLKKENDTQTRTSSLLPKSELNMNFLENVTIMHSSSSSQTSLNNLNFFEDSSFGNCNSQTQTDVIFQDEFLHSHIETQTNEVQDLDLCSNMYTQTCDEALLSELEFTNIQTQTNWPDYDMFVSTETQTLLTHNTKVVLDMGFNGREISHMETQTDIEFKQLLEEINA